MESDEEIDFLEVMGGLQAAFPETGNVGHNELNPGLAFGDLHRPVLVPVSLLEPVETVGKGFGPQLAGTVENFSFKVERQSATTLYARRMTLFIERPTGPPETIQVRPRLNRTNVTRGDVEMAVARWMTERQTALDIISQPVPLQSSFELPAVPHATVWVWRGLKRRYTGENIWQVFL